jgi:DNA-binding FadR family transcriptional regulator
VNRSGEAIGTTKRAHGMRRRRLDLVARDRLAPGDRLPSGRERMARRAAARPAAADLDRLEVAVAAQAAALPGTAAFYRCDGVFRREIAAVSGNPIWPAVSDAVFRRRKDVRAERVTGPGRESRTVSEHRDISAAIRTRRPDRAAAAVAQHPNRANALYRPSEVVS